MWLLVFPAAALLFWVAFTLVRGALLDRRHSIPGARVARPVPVEWSAWLDRIPHVSRLVDGERERILQRMTAFLEDVHFEGAGGLALTEEMRVTVAAQACLIALNLPDDCYAGVREVLLYPTTYVAHQFTWTPSKDPVSSTPQLGESWNRGSVVLAWDSALAGGLDARDGNNVVYHEFAHQLDSRGGRADGAPLLRGEERIARWRTVLEEDFESLRQDLREGRPTTLSPYAATNPAEFFAVATEVFFERPSALKRRHPELYAELLAYYQQDPERLDPEPEDGDPV